MSSKGSSRVGRLQCFWQQNVVTYMALTCSTTSHTSTDTTANLNAERRLQHQLSA